MHVPDRTEGFLVILKVLNNAVYVIEVFAAVALVVMTALAAVTLGIQIIGVASTSLAMGSAEFTTLISTILEIFILIELFRIAVAYMTHRNVLPTVFEAALVAVARKFVVFEVGDQTLPKAAALSLLLVAVAVSWWMLARIEVFQDGPVEHL